MEIFLARTRGYSCTLTNAISSSWLMTAQKYQKIQQNYPVVPGPIQSQKWQHAYL